MTPPNTTTVRGAVAERDNAPAKVTPQAAIKQQLDLYAPVITQLLPKHISTERFAATVGNACRATPELLACNPQTILAAALKAAQLGLEPNDSRNQCWILPYAGKASFQLGYGGVLELARRADSAVMFTGNPVYPNDEFDLDYGRAQPLLHKPAVARGLPRGGPAIAWYVQARYPDGRIFVHALDKEGVEYHRGFSKQPNGKMWKDSYDAAALKSVVMDMRRWLPQSTEFADAVNNDDKVLKLDDGMLLPDEDVEKLGQIDHTPDEPAKEPEPKGKQDVIDTTGTDTPPAEGGTLPLDK